jgi:hypothetical protein
MVEKMLNQVLEVINAAYPDDKPYTGFTLIATNEDGFRVGFLNVDTDTIVKQIMVLMRETNNALETAEEIEEMDKNELH